MLPVYSFVTFAVLYLIYYTYANLIYKKNLYRIKYTIQKSYELEPNNMTIMSRDNLKADIRDITTTGPVITARARLYTETGEVKRDHIPSFYVEDSCLTTTELLTLKSKPDKTPKEIIFTSTGYCVEL